MGFLGFNTEKIREDFPIIQKKVNGKPIIYLDNAATSLKPIQVIEKLNYYYKECTANIHRGLHRMSEEASILYEESHAKTAKLINAKGSQEIVFTRNATESLNLLMYSLQTKNFFKKGDEILISKMEHHSNIVPWQFLEKKIGIKLKTIELNEDYTLNMQDFEKKLNEKTKIVSITHASNTVAAINPVKEITAKAKKNGSIVIIDGSQSVPHMPVNVKEINSDFLVFSGHKMLGPTGIGVLYGRKKLLEEMPPFLYGGDMITEVHWKSSSWNALPYKFEAGTPNIAGGIAFGEAIDYLKKIGLENVRKHEKQITKYALERITEIKGIKTFCPRDSKKQGGIILFQHEKIEAHDLALALDEANNIAIRSGMHCAQPLVESLNPKGLARASFYFYTTEKEIDLFVETLKEIVSMLA